MQIIPERIPLSHLLFQNDELFKGQNATPTTSRNMARVNTSTSCGIILRSSFPSQTLKIQFHMLQTCNEQAMESLCFQKTENLAKRKPPVLVLSFCPIKLNACPETLFYLLPACIVFQHNSPLLSQKHHWTRWDTYNT